MAGLSVPRIRGDDPPLWTCETDSTMVFPAYAGMIPQQHRQRVGGRSVPRIRGDDPSYGQCVAEDVRCSPHTRG